jgi:hypothetical protein
MPVSDAEQMEGSMRAIVGGWLVLGTAAIVPLGSAAGQPAVTNIQFSLPAGTGSGVGNGNGNGNLGSGNGNNTQLNNTGNGGLNSGAVGSNAVTVTPNTNAVTVTPNSQVGAATPQTNAAVRSQSTLSRSGRDNGYPHYQGYQGYGNYGLQGHFPGFGSGSMPRWGR